MSTFADRPHTALLVMDVQNGVEARSINRDATVATIASLVDRARNEDVPVPPRSSRSWPSVPWVG